MIKWDNSDYLMHYGIKGRSGRYPAGSGEHPKTGPRANRKLATLQAKKEKNQKKIDKFYSRPKLPNGMPITEFGVAKEKRLLRKERKLDAKIRKIEKSQKAEDHDFNNPKFSGVDRKGNTFTKKELDAMRIPSPKSYGSASKKYEKTVKVAPAGFLRRQMQMEVAGIKGTSNYYKQNAKTSNSRLMKSIYDLAGAGYGAESRISAALNKKLFNIDQNQIDKGKQILVDKKLYKKVLSEKKNKNRR